MGFSKNKKGQNYTLSDQYLLGLSFYLSVLNVLSIGRVELMS